MVSPAMVASAVNPARTPRSIQVEADSPKEAVSTAQDAAEASHGSPLARLAIGLHLIQRGRAGRLVEAGEADHQRVAHALALQHGVDLLEVGDAGDRGR